MSDQWHQVVCKILVNWNVSIQLSFSAVKLAPEISKIFKQQTHQQQFLSPFNINNTFACGLAMPKWQQSASGTGTAAIAENFTSYWNNDSGSITSTSHCNSSISGFIELIIPNFRHNNQTLTQLSALMQKVRGDLEVTQDCNAYICLSSHHVCLHIIFPAWNCQWFKKKFSFSQINGRSGILEQQNACEIYALHNSLSTFNANLPSCYHYLSRNIFLKKSESQLLLTQGIPPFEFLILMRGHRLWQITLAPAFQWSYTDQWTCWGAVSA